jgi:hypothetical protein
MAPEFTDAITALAALVATASALYARRQTKVAKAALAQQSELRLFEAFAECSNALIQTPTLLHLVHGIPQCSCEDDEGKALAYLCAILDAFQIYYHEKFNGDFRKMESELIQQSTFLSRILAIPENKSRIDILRCHFYGNFDKPYMGAIERVIEYYERNAGIET